MQGGFRRVLLLAAGVVFATTVVGCAAAWPLTPATVEARLRTLDRGLSLVPTKDDRDMGVFPKLQFRPQTTSSSGVGASLGLVLVYPSTAERVAHQDDFHEMSVQGPRGVINWDGFGHSEWVGAENVIVEVLMSGGTFGGRSPTPDEATYPSLVFDALNGVATPATTAATFLR